MVDCYVCDICGAILFAQAGVKHTSICSAVLAIIMPTQVLPSRPVLRRCFLAPYVPLTVMGSANVPVLA